jgi:DNA-binding response OmpR family regulator
MDQKKILVVDDEPIGRQLLQAVLLPEGYDVIVAESGMDAIDKMISFIPDLVLLDVMMPGMDGYETMKKVKVNDSINHIPVIFITALDDRDSRIRGLESGANDYIAKPFDRIEILTKIKNLILNSPADKPSVNKTAPSTQLINEDTLDKIAKEIYNFDEHNKKFSGKISLSLLDIPMLSLLSGWYGKINNTELHCFFGPMEKNDVSAVGTILISNWLSKYVFEIPSHPNEVCSHVFTKIQNSDILIGNNKSWWMIVFMTGTDNNWLLSGFNQTMFSSLPTNPNIPSATSENFVKLNHDKELSVKQDTAFYFFSPDITSKLIEPEIINAIQQTNSLDFAHEFLKRKTDSLSTFAIQIMF